MKLVVNHGPIFQFLFRMMGAEAMSYAMVENPDLLRAVADKVGELSVQIVESIVQRDWVGGIWYGDDMAKGGVISMTRDMAVYLAADDIRVNAISPGGFWRGHSEQFTRQYSDGVPMRRMRVDGNELKGPGSLPRLGRITVRHRAQLGG